MARPLSDLELLRLHAAALFTDTEGGRIRTVNEPNGRSAPRFYLGRTRVGSLTRFRSDVPDDLASALLRLSLEEPTDVELAHMPQSLGRYQDLLESHSPIRGTWAGPAYSVPVATTPHVEPEETTGSSSNLLRGGLEDWIGYLRRGHPFKVATEDGRVVAVCTSVRVTAAAHEAGVQVLRKYQRRGHGANVVARWANAVRSRGAIPMYSTSWDNVASLRLAARLGLSMFGVDYHVT